MADSLCFVTGAHIDLTARIFAPAVIHASNPGTVTARPGGAGLNSASTAASLGAAAVMASPIGPDAHGEILRQTLAARGIADALVTVEGLRTGTYTAIIEPDGSMLIGLADLAIYESVAAGWFFDNCGPALETSGLWFLNANLPAQTLAGSRRKGGRPKDRRRDHIAGQGAPPCADPAAYRFPVHQCRRGPSADGPRGRGARRTRARAGGRQACGREQSPPGQVRCCGGMATTPGSSHRRRSIASSM